MHNQLFAARAHDAWGDKLPNIANWAIAIHYADARARARAAKVTRNKNRTKQKRKEQYEGTNLDVYGD